jgi:hypothetical protein
MQPAAATDKCNETKITIIYGKVITRIYCKIHHIYYAFYDSLKAINKNYHILSIYLTINDLKTPKTNNTNTPRPDSPSFKINVLGASFLREIDWGYRLYLDRKLYLACVRLQADKKLSKSKAGLLALTEGLHSLGYLSDGDHEVYKAKYSISLDFKPLTPTQIKEQETKANRDRQLNRHYKQVLEQWNTLSEKAKSSHLKRAEENKHLKYAKRVLELGKSNMKETST